MTKVMRKQDLPCIWQVVMLVLVLAIVDAIYGRNDSDITFSDQL